MSVDAVDSVHEALVGVEVEVEVVSVEDEVVAVVVAAVAALGWAAVLPDLVPGRRSASNSLHDRALAFDR